MCVRGVCLCVRVRVPAPSRIGTLEMCCAGCVCVCGACRGCGCISGGIGDHTTPHPHPPRHPQPPSPHTHTHSPTPLFPPHPLPPPPQPCEKINRPDEAHPDFPFDFPAPAVAIIQLLRLRSCCEPDNSGGKIQGENSGGKIQAGNFTRENVHFRGKTR